ncbi:MAG: ABC transporter ATP-binding protein [bacterium]|nr:ABC transporter ATP-binding protein [bacterium]
MDTLLSTLWRYFKKRPKMIVGYVVLTILMIALWIVDPLLARYLIDKIDLLVQKQFDTHTFLILFGLLVACSIGLSLIQACHKLVCWRMLNYTYINFQIDTYKHIVMMDVIQHIQRRSGAIIKKIDNAADQLWDLGFQIFQVIVPSVISGVIFLGIAFHVSPHIATAITIILCFYAAILAYVTRKAHPLQKVISRIWVSVIGRAYDVASNILQTKSAPAEHREVQRMRYWNERGLALQKTIDWYWGILEGFSIFMFMRTVILGLGIYYIAQGELTLGELFFFIFISFRLISPIEVIGNFLPKWNEKMEKIRMGVQMGQISSQVHNPKHGKKLKDLKGEIVLNDVSFSYDASNNTPVDADEEEEDEIDVLDPRINIHEKDPMSKHAPISLIKRNAKKSSSPSKEALQELNLTIKPGEHIALVGHSGAGKSTIAALLCRFFDVTKGAILIDGIDMRELDLFWWRSNVGLILQDNTMFNDTIIENIRYGKPSATDGDVIDAAERASAHTFIQEMPEKYYTGIGERGVRLSGGERQRIAIARAILKKPKIVLLDEATSALDSKTEKDVQEGIAALIEGKTAVIIAHRLSTVRSCDRIAVLDKGKLVACAPHTELMKICPIYKEMVELQIHGMLAE